MSTKVYVAYKLKPHVTKSHVGFWAWARETQARAEQEVRLVIRQVYCHMADNLKADDEAYLRYLTSFGAKDSSRQRLTFCHNTLVQNYKKQVASSLRDDYDFDVTIAIRELHGDLYITPYYDMACRHVLDFMKEDKRLSDFAYWDNADPPEGMREGSGYRRWKARGKVWDQIDPHIREYLLITVCDSQKFMYVDPWMEMLRDYPRRAGT